jgi:predicted AlkP superfamily phosphohydrolase/phosphomutase
LNHYLWEDYEDAASPFHQAFLDFYHEVDKAIAHVVDSLDDGVNVIVVSDHGFGPQKISVNVNCILREYGYLQTTQGERTSYKDIQPASKAFAMDPGRVYIHRQGRYPKAELGDEQAEEVMLELTRLFLDLEVDGRPIVQRVLRGAEVYSGPYAHRAPDLVLMAADDVALSGRMNLSDLIEPTPINGKHTFEHSTFFYRGQADIELPQPMRVEDVLGVLRTAERRRLAA